MRAITVLAISTILVFTSGHEKSDPKHEEREEEDSQETTSLPEDIDKRESGFDDHIREILFTSPIDHEFQQRPGIVDGENAVETPEGELTETSETVNSTIDEHVEEQQVNNGISEDTDEDGNDEDNVTAEASLAGDDGDHQGHTTARPASLQDHHGVTHKVVKRRAPHVHPSTEIPAFAGGEQHSIGRPKRHSHHSVITTTAKNINNHRLETTTAVGAFDEDQTGHNGNEQRSDLETNHLEHTFIDRGPFETERRVSRAGSSRRNRVSAVNRGQSGSSNAANGRNAGDGADAPAPD